MLYNVTCVLSAAVRVIETVSRMVASRGRGQGGRVTV